MHRAHWQQDHDADLARDTAYAATEARGLIACLSCGLPAHVYVRIDAQRFSAPLCDDCAVERIQYATRARADVGLGRVHGVDVVTVIETVDLVGYARECLDGVVGDCDLAAMGNVPGAVRQVIGALSARLSRMLAPSEQLAVGIATHHAFLARRSEMRASLTQTQTALRSPFPVFARRVG